MGSLVTETPILTRPNPAGYGPKPDIIVLPAAEFTDLVVTGTFNGDPIGSGWLTPDGPATLNNKKLVADTCSFIDAADTRSLVFDLAGTGSTTVRLDGTAARVLSVADTAGDAALLIDSAPAIITAEYTFATGLAAGTDGFWRIIPVRETSAAGVVTPLQSLALNADSVYMLGVKFVGRGTGGAFITQRMVVNVSVDGAGVVTISAPYDEWVSDVGYTASLSWVAGPGTAATLQVDAGTTMAGEWRGTIDCCVA